MTDTEILNKLIEYLKTCHLTWNAKLDIDKILGRIEFTKGFRFGKEEGHLKLIHFNANDNESDNS